MSAAPHQVSLFGRGKPSFDPRFVGLRRKRLDATAWVDHLPGWVSGHEDVFDHLVNATEWRSHRRLMYERMVDVPRLWASFPDDGEVHPLLSKIAMALSKRYLWELRSISAAYYRDGHDSVALHGDRVGPLKDNSLVAIVSVGEPRKFMLRPAGRGPSISYQLGWGDLLVMGGSCQRDWEHGVPKVASAGPRISIMFWPKLPEE